MKVALLVLACLACAFAEDIYTGITIQNVERTIDLTSQLAVHNLAITLSNTGSQTVSHIYLTVQKQFDGHLSSASVTDQSGASLKVVRSGEQTQQGGFALYRVELGKSLAPEGSANLKAKLIFTHTQTPFPTSIAQSERQYVRYSDNHVVFTPYAVKTQTTTVKLPSSSIESKTEFAPTSVKGDTITYGPYADVAAFTNSPLSLHFENNKPFITITDLVREFEISHWGNLALEETYQLQHDGAKLKGAFSRYHYQRNQGGAPAHVPVLPQTIPADAADIYYRDEIGNISTSTVANADNGLQLSLTPRYPLFGGWKAAFYIGYNLPLYNYLFKDNEGLFWLNVTFAPNFGDLAVIDHETVRIIFPEGASDIQVHTPFPVDGQSEAVHFTYLDTKGRPVKIIEKKNVASAHHQYFQVSYKFSQSAMLREPLLLVGAFLAFFVAVMLYTRVELNVGTPSKRRSANADKVVDQIFKIKDISDQRSELHAALDRSLEKLLKSKNINQYSTEKKQLEAALANAKREIQNTLAQVEALDAESAKLVRELERKEERRTAVQNQVHDLEVNYRIKKTTTSTFYDESKDGLAKLYSAADDEVEAVANEILDSV